MSYFLYIHADTSNSEGVWKVGKSLTPYSAVRSRQKNSWKQFELDYLWFGYPQEIHFLEKKVKRHFYKHSGKYKTGYSQTELFQIPVKQIVNYINETINDNSLLIQSIELKEKYCASKSGSCPFGIPSEKYASEWLNDKLEDLFPQNQYVMHSLPAFKKSIGNKNNFFQLFEIS